MLGGSHVYKREFVPRSPRTAASAWRIVWSRSSLNLNSPKVGTATLLITVSLPRAWCGFQLSGVTVTTVASLHCVLIVSGFVLNALPVWINLMLRATVCRKYCRLPILQ